MELHIEEGKKQTWTAGLLISNLLTDEQQTDKPSMIRCEETYSTWQYLFKLEFFRSIAKRFVLKKLKKNVFHLVLLNYMQRFFQNHWGKGDFSVQNFGIFL